MNFLELRHNGNIYNNNNDILKILDSEGFYWLIDSEVNDAIIEINNNTIIWHGGIFMSGDWYYGIFKNGKFFGKWENGIFEHGHFNGEWISGIDLSKNN
jgi:hypothetical protein